MQRLFSATLKGQVWGRRAETVKSQPAAVEMDLSVNCIAYVSFSFFQVLPEQTRRYTIELLPVKYYYLIVSLWLSHLQHQIYTKSNVSYEINCVSIQ